MNIENTNGEVIPDEKLACLFAYYESLRGLDKGTFVNLWRAAETSESARWAMMLASDFELLPGAE